MFQIVLLYAASTFPLSKIALSYMHPLFLLGIRMTIPGILLLAYTIYKKAHTALHKRHITLYIQAILCASFLPYTLRYYGMQNTSLSEGYLLLNMGPLITYTVNCLYNKEVISKQKITILLMAFFSSLFLMRELFFKAGALSNLGFSFSSLLLLASVICFSYGWIIIKKLMTTHNHSPITVNMVTMLGSGLLSLAISLFISTPVYTTDLQTLLPLLIPIIFMSNLIGHTWYAYLAKQYSLTLLALGCHLSPFFTATYQYLLFGAPLKIDCFLTGLVISVLMLIYYVIEQKSEPVGYLHTLPNK